MSEKIVGYVLLILGVAVILVAAVNAFQVFTGQSKPIQVINTNTPLVFNMTIPSETGESIRVPVDLGQTLPLANISNLVLHVMLMGFMVTVGSKLAGIGATLVRPIVVKAK